MQSIDFLPKPLLVIKDQRGQLLLQHQIEIQGIEENFDDLPLQLDPLPLILENGKTQEKCLLRLNSFLSKTEIKPLQQPLPSLSPAYVVA